ncbi:UvrD-helicase domain-containing protein, partial [Clostridium saudiense]|nr:UvrD-helicase domain-containing protein [Clostridium saudiense]
VKSNSEDSDERRAELRKLYDERDKIKSYIKQDSKKVMNEYFKNWRGITSKDIYLNMFKDETVFDIAVDNRIPFQLLEYMKEEVIGNFEKGIVDEDDLAALLYIHILLEGIEDKSKFKHIVVDEAQDYSPLQIEVITNLTRGNSLTLVGDLAQGIYYYKGIKNWKDVTEKIFNGNATFISLTQSYRSTVEIIDFAKTALEAQNLGITSAKPVLRHGDDPVVKISNDKKESAKLIEDIIQEIESKGKSSIGIITRTIEEGKELEKNIKKYCKRKIQLIKG